MKVEHYISQLLYRYQCVTIPGFGAFLTEIQSAQLFESTNAFYPPKKSLFFNTHLKNNDGLLANHIARIENISYEEAVASIQEEVLSWEKTLQSKETLLLKNIGVLSLNSENNLVFVASLQLNYLTASFGLASFVSPTVKREVYKQQVEALEEKAPIIFTPETKNSRSYLKYAAVLVLALGIITVGLKLRDNRIESETLLVEKAVQEEVETKIQEATFFISSPLPSVTLTVKEEKLPYHVVGGAFTAEANAEKEYKNLTQLGFKAQKMEKNKHGLYTVYFGSFATYAEAQKILNEVQKKHNPEAWLLID